MSERIKDLESEDRDDLENLLETKSTEMGINSWSSTGGRSDLLQDQIGICFNCRQMSYCKSEFGSVLATCSEFKIRLTGQNRITECNEHETRGIMSLDDMQNVALLVDVEENVTKGFISLDPKLRKKAGF